MLDLSKNIVEERGSHAVDDDEIIEMHLERHMSPDQIGTELCVNQHKVRRRLKELEAYVPYISCYKESDLTDEELTRLHTEERLSVLKISKMHKICNKTISRRLKDLGIYVKGLGQHDTTNRDYSNISKYDKLPISREEFVRLHVEKDLPITKIFKIYEKKLGSENIPSYRTWLKYAKVEKIKQPKEKTKRIDWDKPSLNNLIKRTDKSKEEIAEIYGVSGDTFYKVLEKYNLKYWRRDHIKNEDGKVFKRTDIVIHFLKTKSSIPEMMEFFNIKRVGILSSLKTHGGLKVEDLKEMGIIDKHRNRYDLNNRKSKCPPQ